MLPRPELMGQPGRVSWRQFAERRLVGEGHKLTVGDDRQRNPPAKKSDPWVRGYKHMCLNVVSFMPA
jgi:hypothetical protein